MSPLDDTPVGARRLHTEPIVLGLEVGGEHMSMGLLSVGRDAERPLSGRLLDAVDFHRRDPRESSVLSEIDAMLRRHRLEVRDLSLVAVGRGPGSFTGVRVGLAVALGLSLGSGVAAWPVCSLAALALNATSGHALALLDARKGEVYGGLFRLGNGPPEVLLAPTLGTCEAVTALATSALREAVGDGATFVALGSGALVHGVTSPLAPAAHVGRGAMVAWLAAQQWHVRGFDASHAPPLDAVYLRKSEAEIALGSG